MQQITSASLLAMLIILNVGIYLFGFCHVIGALFALLIAEANLMSIVQAKATEVLKYLKKILND